MESDRETRERLRLTAAICDELKKQDALKNKILEQLGQGGRFQRLTQHPASIVLLTFALTTVVGSYLTSKWQRLQQEHDQKYEVINDTAKSIAQIHAATTSVLAALQIGKAELRKSELDRTVPKWRETKNEWLVNQAVLAGKIAANFPNDSADAIKNFDDIFYSYKRVNVEIGNMLETLENNDEAWQGTQTNVRTQLETINNDTRDKAKALIERLNRQLAKTGYIL